MARISSWISVEKSADHSTLKNEQRSHGIIEYFRNDEILLTNELLNSLLRKFVSSFSENLFVSLNSHWLLFWQNYCKKKFGMWVWKHDFFTVFFRLGNNITYWVLWMLDQRPYISQNETNFCLFVLIITMKLIVITFGHDLGNFPSFFFHREFNNKILFSSHITLLATDRNECI